MPRKKKTISHVDENGKMAMVDISGKTRSRRRAIAHAVVTMNGEAFRALVENRSHKGDVLACAHVGGIAFAKEAYRLIPLCHPISISHISLLFEPLPESRRVAITAEVKARDATGVEMEALAAATGAALTIIDMLKSLDKAMIIGPVELLLKEGGAGGRYEKRKS